MASTALCTNASANGFYPSAAGQALVSPFQVESRGYFGPALATLEVAIDGTNYVPVPDGEITSPKTFRLQMGDDSKIRVRIDMAGVGTSITILTDPITT